MKELFHICLEMACYGFLIIFMVAVFLLVVGVSVLTIFYLLGTVATIFGFCATSMCK